MLTWCRVYVYMKVLYASFQVVVTYLLLLAAAAAATTCTVFTRRQHNLLCRCPVLAMAKASVWLSVCLSPSAILSKRHKLGSRSLHHEVREGCCYQDLQRLSTNLEQVTPIKGAEWDNYVNVNESTPILSVTKMFARDCSLWRLAI